MKYTYEVKIVNASPGAKGGDFSNCRVRVVASNPTQAIKLAQETSTNPTIDLRAYKSWSHVKIEVFKLKGL